MSRRTNRRALRRLSLIWAAACAVGLAAPGWASAASATAGTHVATWHENLSVLAPGDVNVKASSAGFSVLPASTRPAGTRPGSGSAVAYLPEHTLAAPARRVHFAESVRRPAGSTVELAIRGELADGHWSGWAVADSAGDAVLSRPASTVQARIILTDSASGAAPTISSLTETAASSPLNEFYQDIQYASGSWQGWAPLAGFNGAVSFEGPAQATAGLPDGSSQDLGVGLNGLVYQDIRNSDGSWRGWAQLPGYNGAPSFSIDSTYNTGSVAITGVPVVATNSLYGTSEVAVIGEDDMVYYGSRSSSGTWAPLSQVPGLNGAQTFPAKKVAITALSNGSTVLAAFDTTNGDLYYITRSAAGSWGSWVEAPGFNGATTFAGPDVAVSSTSSGAVGFLGVGLNGMLYLNTLTPSTGAWVGWQELPGFNGDPSFQTDGSYATAGVGIAGMPDGSTQLLAIGLNDQIYQNVEFSNGSSQGWNPLQNNVSGPLYAATVSITAMPDGSSQIIATNS